jgi:hypothetical protein
MTRIGEFFAKSGERCVSGRVLFVREEKGQMKTSLRASLWGRSSGNSANLTEQTHSRGFCGAGLVDGLDAGAWRIPQHVFQAIIHKEASFVLRHSNRLYVAPRALLALSSR